MQIFLLTDIPVWVRSLEKALQVLGAEVKVGQVVPTNFQADVIVNRLSTAVLRQESPTAPELSASLKEAEEAGRRVINGSECFEIGLSKMRQAQLFLEAGAQTPETAALSLEKRVFVDREVLLKPAAGGFGKGILRLGPGEAIPQDLDITEGWVEQVAILPSDGLVHRLEFVGKDILYHAASPWKVDEFDYCLANVGAAAQLERGADLPRAIAEPAKAIARKGGLQLGALEYFVLPDGSPSFIDFNPVSSLHKRADALLRRLPIEEVADFVTTS